jgi:predicted AAA+ superfamily ATPase
MAGEVGDWQQFSRLIRLISALTAQEINYSQLGRGIGMTPQTARRWLAILQGTFQWIELPAFSGNAVKRVSGKLKGHFADTGLVCHLAQLNSPAAIGGHPLLGALFETAMVHELRKQDAALPGSWAEYHWRSAGGAEVDFLLERDGWFHPFEIKLTGQPTRRDASGLLAFRQAYPKRRIGKGAILCGTERPHWITDDVAALPWNWI